MQGQKNATLERDSIDRAERMRTDKPKVGKVERQEFDALTVF
jgi:hypothetical protein